MRRQSTLMQLAGGFIAGVLGTFPILAGLGLLRGGDDIEPVGRVLAVGFGAVFVAIGLVVLGQAFLAMAGAPSHRGDLRARPEGWAAGRGAGMCPAGGGLYSAFALPHLLRPRRVERPVAVMAVSRWALKFACFILLAAIMTHGDLERADVTGLGAVCFTVLGLLELFRVMDLPLDLARSEATATPITNR